MALTAQKVALMVLMLGLMMMGVTVLALAEDSLPSGRETDAYIHNATYSSSAKKEVAKSRYAGFAKAVAKQGFVKPDYTPDRVSTEAVDGLPEPFGQQLN